MNSRTNTLRFCRRGLILLTVLGLVTACNRTAVKTDGSPEQAAEAQAFSTRCSICHALPAPKRHNYAEWQTLIGIMEQRMNERGMGVLSDEDRTAILAYLKRNGR